MKHKKTTLAQKKKAGGVATHKKYDEEGRKVSRNAASPHNPDKRAYHSANQEKRHDKNLTRFCPSCNEILFNNVTICHQCGKELAI